MFCRNNLQGLIRCGIGSMVEQLYTSFLFCVEGLDNQLLPTPEIVYRQLCLVVGILHDLPCLIAQVKEKYKSPDLARILSRSQERIQEARVVQIFYPGLFS